MPYTHWLRKNGTIATARRSALTGKTPAELVLMAETRKLLQLLLHSEQEEISPDLRTTIQAILRSRFRRTAPFMPLNDEQRIAWLDDTTHITCHTNLDTSFTAEREYRVQCHDTATSHIIERATMHGSTEEVHITGNELIITIIDNHQRPHAFCYEMLPDAIGIHAIHPIQTLTAHFTIPQAQDITQLYPATYIKLKRQLAEL